VFIGYFDNENDSALAYDCVAKKYNFPSYRLNIK